MYSRIIQPPSRSFFLFGARGTGKTSWIKTTFPDNIYIDLLESETYRRLLTEPSRLEKMIPPQYRQWVILDEVQRVPDILNEVHRLIESKKYRFILTGSSARKLKKKGVNLLAGRALTYYLYPLTVTELGKDFKLEKSVVTGHLPVAYTDSKPEKYLESYVSTYLREEIQQEGLTRNLSAFSRFLEMASFSQGSLLTLSDVARDTAIERKVVENYFSILEDLLLASRLPVFTKRAKRRLVSHPKFYFFDVGVYRTLRPKGPLDNPEEIGGVAFESLFFQELKALNSYLDLGYHLYYWRTSNNLEVDFVLYGKRGLKAFEIKHTKRLGGHHFSGLRAFLREYPMAKAYLVYGGQEHLFEKGIEILPIETCLKNLQTFL
ncbi:MAG: ATPase [Deltaproteobacteria bacterium RIFCSPLOWO2_12_FULL_40_28]|nr:MAG: ATPase [Deltaproteobacteria bacterium RIFCSPHIGHO2_02_FULL_40_28]OGQ19126.1 MAG: ATPase [Deltaproteobacteria bacterium RIFCSPHIGHO2_12_FULL_40_32]OGQ40298.1 MAG: ATPase [Deltaproteobacteria bacterium RIFCSPLOWO2_02_FULL_40_36]OGQ53569.1 MAG: ATPase [Deltaproteobacteria bacterium RIFCSPLOWO2_12_FULL_40_28]